MFRSDSNRRVDVGNRWFDFGQSLHSFLVLDAALLERRDPYGEPGVEALYFTALVIQ